MASLHELTSYLDSLMQPSAFNDYCPNGLQVEGRSTVNKIVTGVTANLALIEAAITENADAILVHHGYFWQGEDLCITGIKQKRIAKLLKHDMSVIAYHLPLDAHSVYGNNIQLAKILNFKTDPLATNAVNTKLLFTGKLAKLMSGKQLAEHIAKHLYRTPLYIATNNKVIKRVAWCTGAAQDYINCAIALNCDAFITGEVSERTVHIAREAGIHFYAAGHHATERYGIKALGEHLADRFGIEQQFIDIDNPV